MHGTGLDVPINLVPGTPSNRLGAFRKFVREDSELVAASRALPPDKADLSRRVMGEQRTGNEIGPKQHPGVDFGYIAACSSGFLVSLT